MNGRRCTRCGNRLRIRLRSCRHCGWRETPRPGGARSRRRSAGYAIGLVLGLCALLFVGHRMIEPTAIADWYAEFAIQHLPRQFSSVAPAASASGAYFFCIRRVVKDKLERESVATFPGISNENTLPLGDGGYRVETHVVEDRVDGERLRWSFTCTARYDRNRWVLHDLEMGSYARAE
jgi:hypothetical protein